MTKILLSTSILVGLSACGATTMGTQQFASATNSSVAAFIEGPNNGAIAANGAYMIRDRTSDTAVIGAPQTITANRVAATRWQRSYLGTGAWP